MKKLSFKTGGSIIEIIVAVEIFILVSASMVALYLGSYGTVLRDAENLQANMLLQEGLEAARSIRDYDFDNLTNGTHGLTDTNGYWEFSGSSDTNGQFTRTVEVDEVSRNSSCQAVTSGGTADDNSRKIVATVTWELEEGNETSVSATEYLNNRVDVSGCGSASCLIVDTSGAYILGGKKLEGMTIRNMCSYDIAFDKLTPTWTGGNLIEEVRIDNTWVWRNNQEGSPDPKQPSGVKLDLEDHYMPGGGSIYDINHIGFDGNMDGVFFTFLFEMSDGTTKYVEVTPGVAPSDTTAPSAISDLALSNITSGSMDLTWTAPGDDGAVGTATNYDIRYSTTNITSGNWSSAVQVTGEPVPSVAETSQSMTVFGLSEGTKYYFAIKTSDEVPNTSDISNVPHATTATIADVTAPASITNLALSNINMTSMDLTWTSPGDDGAVGTATSYDIRYSTSAINEGNWASALQVTGEPAPQPAGTSQSMTVSGLSGGTTYHFAIKTSDEVPNISLISNVPSATTQSQADALIVDTSAVGLASSNKWVTGITITNSGSANIVIDKMTVTWTGGTSGSKIQGITINGGSKWTGNSNSGTLLNITDFTLISGAGSYPIDRLIFSKSMSGSTISIMFTMGDGSTKTISNIQPH